MPLADRFLFSGHQTFPLRIPWLPKAADAIRNGFNPFSDLRKGIELLGIGKNMVEALRCWVELYGVASFDGDGRAPRLTEFGEMVFGDGGCDPYLEDERTLWLLHWNAATHRQRRFFAWHWVCNVHPELEFSYEEALRAFRAQAESLPKPLSETTLRQHLDVFLGTYVQSNSPLSGVVAEDMLESPLAVLGFIREGEPLPGSHGKNRTYSLDGGRKPGISDEVFRFCIHSGWETIARNDRTCSYRQIGHAQNSPGRIFRLSEQDLYERLQRLARKWTKEFALMESNNQRQLDRLVGSPRMASLLRDVYRERS